MDRYCALASAGPVPDQVSPCFQEACTRGSLPHMCTDESVRQSASVSLVMPLALEADTNFCWLSANGAGSYVGADVEVGVHVGV